MRINRDRIKLAMAEQGINTFAELADRMGCSRQNLSVIMTRGSCSVANLARLAHILGLQPKDIAIMED